MYISGTIPDQFFTGIKEEKKPKPKNLCLKTRPKENPYEIYRSHDGWEWRVLKKYQADDSKPYARWLCFVTSPLCPYGEYGDTYVSSVKTQGYLVKRG